MQLSNTVPVRKVVLSHASSIRMYVAELKGTSNHRQQVPHYRNRKSYYMPRKDFLLKLRQDVVNITETEMQRKTRLLILRAEAILKLLIALVL